MVKQPAARVNCVAGTKLRGSHKRLDRFARRADTTDTAPHFSMDLDRAAENPSMRKNPAKRLELALRVGMARGDVQMVNVALSALRQHCRADAAHSDLRPRRRPAAA